MPRPLRPPARDLTDPPAPFRADGLRQRMAPFIGAAVALIVLIPGPSSGAGLWLRLLIAAAAVTLTALYWVPLIVRHSLLFQVILPAVGLAGALLLTGPGTRLASSGLALGMLGATFLIPFDRLPRTVQTLLPLLAFTLFLVLRIDVGGAGLNYFPFLVLPVLWLALYHRRHELYAGLVIGAVVLLEPPLLGASRMEELPTGFALWATLAMVGITVQGLVARQRAQMAQLALLAETDHLTGLPNRTGWDAAIAAASAAGGDRMAVALFDIDGFQGYNDDWGRSRGDALLRSLAVAWNDALQRDHHLARVGSDEFVALLATDDLSVAIGTCRDLMVRVPENRTVSVAIALWDRREAAEELAGRLDTCLYRENRRHGAIRVAGPNDGPQWSRLLPTLLRSHSISSVFQPIRELETGWVAGYEALARPDAAGTDVSVEGLFQEAQRLGHARDLDWLCRRAALEHARPLGPGINLFVNVGIWSLMDPLHGVDQMELLLTWAGRHPHEVVLELSERESLRDAARLREVVQQYRARGFRFAVDDVGEGHSTLELLASATPEFVKLARSLVVNADQPGAASTIKGVLAFARASGARVIAEGIDDVAVSTWMRDLGVTLGQGYLLGWPAPAATVLAERTLSAAS